MTASAPASFTSWMCSGLLAVHTCIFSPARFTSSMNMEDQLIYSSFNHYSLLQLKQLNDHVQTGILFSPARLTSSMNCGYFR